MSTGIPELGPVTDREYLIYIGVLTTASQSSQLKTREQIQASFQEAGITVAEWARTNGFHRMTVVEILRGTRKGLYGEAHRCAVALGLKEGVVVPAEQFKPAAKSVAHKDQPASTPTRRKPKKAGPAQ